ncbi:hypothetical protein [Streptacidiphilus neutrinimicus]|uniref:hypothetical protein n=1 Tax=Streptacidiphilus neutrinimicus TaxID=105420 RepID=UPI000AD7EF31|nr:hypothetical protein [Streptacidiphilus neutrinimicus]
MSGARFLIATGTDRESGAASPWFGWRLLSANNRELGRGATFFPRREDCEAAVLHLRANLDRAVPVVHVVRPDSLWRWRLEIDGTEAARSGRAYHRLRECRYSLAHFHTGVGLADAAPHALPEQRSSVRRTGGGRAPGDLSRAVAR